jgi:hypothetical protein
MPAPGPPMPPSPVKPEPRKVRVILRQTIVRRGDTEFRVQVFAMVSPVLRRRRYKRLWRETGTTTELSFIKLLPSPN